ncbi:MAG: HAMP domain-containing histidine kinase, partial [Opitutales bacterium]|nr:HAMP domain-containing histidine kinase [Opitutales bacterium]
TPEQTVRITISHYRENIYVAINDNGPGVPASLKEKIFQPDFSTKKSGLSFGLGLGLAIVRQIVDDYGGSSQLDSVPGSTTFTITLPIDKPQ